MNDPDNSANELVAIAKAIRTHGVHGEIVAEMLTDFPERFNKLETVIALLPSGQKIPVHIESHRFQSGRIILKFSDYDSIEAAATLIGTEFVISRENCVTLGEDEFYEWQLIDCRVTTADGSLIGIVKRIWQTGAAPLLIIENDAKRELMVPFTGSICVEVEPAAKLIRIDAPEGLLDW